MTPEDLMKPRYKVIADFPQWSSFKYKIGDLLEKLGIHFVGSGTSRGINENEIDLYPAIFKKLEWWEERKESDMPQYVKKGERFYDLSNANEKYPDSFMFDYPMTEHWVAYYDCLPATKEEYENQNK